jgi:hypothetical protein
MRQESGAWVPGFLGALGGTRLGSLGSSRVVLTKELGYPSLRGRILTP